MASAQRTEPEAAIAPIKEPEFTEVYAVYDRTNKRWDVGLTDIIGVTGMAKGNVGEHFDVVLDAAVADLERRRMHT